MKFFFVFGVFEYVFSEAQFVGVGEEHYSAAAEVEGAQVIAHRQIVTSSDLRIEPNRVDLHCAHEHDGHHHPGPAEDVDEHDHTPVLIENIEATLTGEHQGFDAVAPSGVEVGAVLHVGDTAGHRGVIAVVVVRCLHTHTDAMSVRAMVSVKWGL